MGSIRQILLDGRISELLPENEDDRFPIVCFRESDSIGFVLRKFASESLVSALVLKSSAVSDNPGDHRDRSFSTIFMRDIVGFVDLHTILSSLLRGAFESNIVHYDVESFEAMANKLCANIVSSLLVDAGETYHGQLSQDWALRGNRTASIYSVIQECFLFDKAGTRMRPPRSPAKCIHHVAIFSCPDEFPEPAQPPREGASTPSTTPRDHPATSVATTPTEGATPGPQANPSSLSIPSAATPPSTTAAPPVATQANKISPGAKLCGIISQTDIIRFLQKHAASDCGSGQNGCGIFHRTVKDLGLVGYASAEIPPSPSTTSSENSERLAGLAGPRMTLVEGSVTAIEAFRRICMQRSSGAGILAADGTLRHHLSATDLRCLTPGLFHALLMPVDQFLNQRPLLHDVHKIVDGDEDDHTATRPAKRRRQERAAHLAVSGPIRGVLACQATSTLSEILAIMSNHGVHQVHVVDPDCKPLCAITAVDVLRVIVDSISSSRSDHRAFGQMQLPNARLLSAMGPLHPRPDSTASGLSGGRAVSVSTSVQSDQQAVSRLGSSR